MPDFVILGNSFWNHPSTGGGHSSQQYAQAVMQRGWRASFVQRNGIVALTPLGDMPAGPSTVVMCDKPWTDFFFDIFMEFKRRGSPTIYRIVDNWHLNERGNYCEAREIEFIEAADVVFASSPLSVERFLHVRPDIGLLRNGVDLQLFWNWRGECPGDLVRGSPTVAFMACFGDLKWIDWDTWFYAADACPEMAINVFGDPRRIGPRKFPSNVYLLGVRHNSQLPAYLHNCDVGIMPYDPERTRFNNPLKVMEYLGSGLPVVSCFNISVTDYPYVFFYRDRHEFVSKIRQAACTPIDRNLLYRSLLPFTWQARLDVILARIMPFVEGRRVARSQVNVIAAAAGV